MRYYIFLELSFLPSGLNYNTDRQIEVLKFRLSHNRSRLESVKISNIFWPLMHAVNLVSEGNNLQFVAAYEEGILY